MRSLQVFIITLCLMVGLYLVSGRGFFMPGRFDPSIGTEISGWSARMLGAALLIVAGLGVVALRSFGSGLRAPRDHRWHVRYFAALALALSLIVGAFLTGEQGPTPDWRHRPGTGAAPAR